MRGIIEGLRSLSLEFTFGSFSVFEQFDFYCRANIRIRRYISQESIVYDILNCWELLSDRDSNYWDVCTIEMEENGFPDQSELDLKTELESSSASSTVGRKSQRNTMPISTKNYLHTYGIYRRCGRLLRDGLWKFGIS